MAELIAVVNAGSSSVKFGFYDREGDEPLLLKGQVEQIGVSPTLSASDGDGNEVANKTWPAEGFGHDEAMRAILETAKELLPGSTVCGVGHRVVHGGTRFGAPVEVTPDVIAELEKLSPLAPLHQPHNLAPIKAIAEKSPAITFKACGNTQENMGKAENKAIPLVTQATLVKSGVVRLMELQEQGWTYVRP